MRQIFFVIITVALIAPCLSGQNLIQQADSLYELRGENFDTEKLLADVTNIDQAITIYKKALETATAEEKEEATWKLMRAYYFKGKYTTDDSESKKSVYDQGKDLGKEAFLLVKYVISYLFFSANLSAKPAINPPLNLFVIIFTSSK